MENSGSTTQVLYQNKYMTKQTGIKLYELNILFIYVYERPPAHKLTFINIAPLRMNGRI
ncbi:MAG: hypothetical protein JNJ75_10300 [Cyclobacteriaceae bacterium]|nr:hypothetical protein [Cyclobacteriaceae bacterium]